MTKNDRKLTCPRCHRSIPSKLYLEHVLQHKGQHTQMAKTDRMLNQKASAIIDFICDCGRKFRSKEELRNHINQFDHGDVGRQVCSVCNEHSHVVLPFERLSLCPSCAIGFFEFRNLFGSRLINHTGEEYEQIIKNKIGILLPKLGVEKLPDLSIQVVLITFTENNRGFEHFHNPKGELVFLFSRIPALKEVEKKVFSTVIDHETCHAFLTHRAKLGITDKLTTRKALSFEQVMAAQLAEDIQLEKVAKSENITPLLTDEVDRVSIYFSEVSPVPYSLKQWESLRDPIKLSSMLSVTWTYAEELWYKQVLEDPQLKRKVSDNLKLVYPHYSMHGYSELKDLIISILNEPISKTPEAAENIFKRLLKLFDKYSDENSLNVY